MIGVNKVLPVIEATGEAAVEAIRMPLSLALAKRCDACLRIGGPPAGADAEAAIFHAPGVPVSTRLEDISPA
mgnify:FL=1